MYKWIIILLIINFFIISGHRVSENRSRSFSGPRSSQRNSLRSSDCCTSHVSSRRSADVSSHHQSVRPSDFHISNVDSRLLSPSRLRRDNSPSISLDSIEKLDIN